MLFEPTDRARMIEDQLQRFMDDHVYPNETHLPRAGRGVGRPALRAARS